MTQDLISEFLRIRDLFYAANKKNKRVWYTSFVTGNFRQTFLYTRLTGEPRKSSLKPFLGFCRYCLFDLPMFRKELNADFLAKKELMIATVYVRRTNGKIDESFFGDLILRLRKDGVPLCVIGRVAHNFSWHDEDFVRKNLGDFHFCPSHLLNKWDGLKCLFVSLKSLFSCRYPKEIRKELIKDMLQSHGSEVLTALLYESMIDRVKSVHPEIRILHPFEGNVWESACSLSGQPNVGYQHSAILNDQVKMKKFEGRPLHEKIITTGPEASKILSSLWGYAPDSLEDGYSLRQSGIYSVPPKESAPSQIGKILVLLQGNEHLNSVLESLRKFSVLAKGRIEVCLRPHPAVPVRFMGVSDNDLFSVSEEGDLYKDILSHDVCFYVSSTAAFESVYLGVPVVHIQMNSGIDSDPLFDMPYLKKSAVSPEDMLVRAEEFANYEGFEREIGLARGYFEGYFRKPDNLLEERFRKWLSLSSVS